MNVRDSLFGWGAAAVEFQLCTVNEWCVNRMDMLLSGALVERNF